MLFCLYVTVIGMIGHRGGMMIPRGGIPVMGVGRGEYHFSGPPVDYFFDPYMDENIEIYGGRRPPFHCGIGMFCTSAELAASITFCCNFVCCV